MIMTSNDQRQTEIRNAKLESETGNNRLQPKVPQHPATFQMDPQ